MKPRRISGRILATWVDDSFVFQLRGPIPDDVLAAAAAVHRLPAAHQIDLMNAAVARLPEDERHFVGLARAVLMAELRRREAGLAPLSELPAGVSDGDRMKWDDELNATRKRIAMVSE
jgi:hypothetical protein